MRNVENQPTVIALDHGMDQSRDARSAPPGTLSLLKNCRIRSARLQKRCGTRALPTNLPGSGFRTLLDSAFISRPVEHPAFITSLGPQSIAATSAGHAFTYDFAGGVEEQYVGEFSAAQPVRKRFGIPPGLAAQSVGPYMPSCAVNSLGYIVTAAAFGPELRITVESPDGLLIYALTDPAAAAANMVVRVVRATNNVFFVCYQDIATATISYRQVDVSNGAANIGNATSIVTLADPLSTWDVSTYDAATWFLVYQSGATTVTVSERDSSATQVTSVTFTTTDNQTYLSIWADTVTARVWIGIVDDITGSPQAKFRVYTDALVSAFGPTNLANTGSVPLFGPLYTRTPAAGDAFCVFWNAANSPTRVRLFAAVIQGGSKTREVVQTFNAVPISKPDLQQRVWCMTHGDGTNFEIAKVALVRFVGAEFIAQANSDPTPVVELASPDFEAPGSTYHPFAKPGLAFNAVAVTSESAGESAFFALPFVVTSRTNASGNKEPTHRIETYEYTRWNQEPHRQVARVGRTGFVSGQPTELWGAMEVLTASRREHGGVEIGYVHAPTILSVTSSANASGVPAGTYNYYAVQAWVDDEGNEHLSAPSAPFELALTVASTVTVRVGNCYLGQRPDRSQTTAIRSPPVRLYRTPSGGTDAEELPLAPTNPGGDWTGYVEFSDTVSDSVIDDNEFLYTGGGVLANVLAPSCRYIAVSEERLWCGGLWDSNIIECSKIRVPGEPYNFTGDASHQVVIPGEVSGLAYMDGQVCAFCEDGIYIVSGDGPNDQGAGGFAPPRALVRGIGCPREQSASILETEVGILFRSAMSYYIIPRGYGTPLEIGDKVHDEDELVLSSAATTTSEFRLAHFLVCASGETSSDTVLTLDLTSMQWVRDEYTVNGSITDQGFSEIGEWPDGLALLSYGLQRTDNPKAIWAHEEALTGDEGAESAGATTFISMYVQTAWQYGSWGPMGWGRVENVSLLFEAVGACGLNMTVEAGDNGSSVAAEQSAAQWTIAASSNAQYRTLTVKFPSCAAYRITLYDAATSGNSSGVRMIALGAMTPTLGGMRPPINDTERQ